MSSKAFSHTHALLNLSVRMFMACVVAKALGRHVNTLPPLSDEQLWQSFKKASLAVSYVDVPHEIACALTPGAVYALEVGKWLDSSVFPEGNHLAEIEDRATSTGKPIDEFPGRDCWVAFVRRLVAHILKEMKHPAAGLLAGYLGTEESRASLECICAEIESMTANLAVGINDNGGIVL